MKKEVLFFVFSLTLLLVSAQVEDQPMDSIAEKMIIIEGDSIMHNSIVLDEVYVFSKLKFSSYMVKSMRLQTRPTVKEGDLAGL